MAQILVWETKGMMVLYIETPEGLVWREGGEYNFGKDGMCGIVRTFR